MKAWRSRASQAILSHRYGLLVFLSIFTTDWLVLWQGPPPRLATKPMSYLFSLVVSLCFWIVLFRLASFYKLFKWALIALLPLFGLALGSAWQMHEVSVFPNMMVLIYLVQEPESAWVMSSSKLTAPLPWMGLALGILWAVAASRVKAVVSDRSTRVITCISVLLIPVIIEPLPEAQPFRFAPYSSDVRLLNSAERAISHVLTKQTSFPVVTQRDAPVLPDVLPPKPTHNVLIIMTESLRPDHLSLYGYDREETAPELAKLADERSEDAHIYAHAFSNAAYTAFSMVSAWTGLSITSTQRLSSEPLLWHYARSLGLKSFYFSSQNVKWANMRYFLFSVEPPDTMYSPLNSDHPPNSEVSIDDRLAAKELATHLTNMPAEERFFGVFQTYATHVPFFADPEDLPENPTTIQRYDASIRVTDEAIGLILDALRETGRLDHTLIIFTTDHSEFILREEQDKARKQERLRANSCHPSITHIPLMMIPPKHMRERAVAPHDKIVSLVDLAPTVLDSWGLPYGHMDGESLFDTSPTRDKIARCASSAEPYPSSLWGFAIYTPDGTFYDRHDHVHMHYYPLNDDSAYTTWDRGVPDTAEVQRMYMRYVNQDEQLQKLRADVEAKR